MWESDAREGPGIDRPGGRGPPIDPRTTVVPRVLVMLLLVGLFADFVIGVAVSVWGPALPSSVSTLFGPNAGSYGWLSVHAFLAVVLVILGILLIAFAGRLHRPRLLFGAVTPFVFLLLAAVSGYALVASSGNGSYVVLMAVFFLGAWTFYAMLATRLRRAAWMAVRRERMMSGAPPGV